MTMRFFGRCGRSAAAVVVLVFVACGCGGSGEYDSPILNEDVPVADIADLPDIEQTRAQMLDLIERVRAEVSRLVPGTEPWWWNRDESRSGCAQKGTDQKGVSLGTRNLVSDTALAGAEWDLVYPTVKQLAADAGLTEVAAMANSSSHHDFRFSSDDGRTLVFVSAEASLISGRIACRRSAAATSSVPTTPGERP